MYPSLKTPVIGSELILLNLTVLRDPWCAGAGAQSVLWTRRGSSQNFERRLPVERWQVEKARYAIHVEQLQLLGVTREADSDDRSVGEEHIVLPHLQRQRREHVVVADDDVGRNFPGKIRGGIQPHGVAGRDSQFSEVSRDVLTQKAMTRNTKCAEL